MARCKYEKIKNLEVVFDKIRDLKDIKETKPGIFYLKNQGFLHFHEKDEMIWADVRDGKDWGTPLNIPNKITKAFLRNFFKDIKGRYCKTIEL